MSGCTVCDGGECCDMRERARVVGVLDAYAERLGCRAPSPYPIDGHTSRTGKRWQIEWSTQDTDGMLDHAEVTGETPDAARAAAAKAIEAGAR